MSYSLKFKTEALREWCRLDANIRNQFRKKLTERLIHPHIPSAKLFGQKDLYKIKLRSAGYRLVYEVRDSELIVTVIAVGRRDRNAVYKTGAKRQI
ncbi:MAG: type II toxin-antitoxin system RelE/ParE family toxin [Alphaproteobacteria bacterium]|nr:type II toxin-antitoxin system RelE/ParE family toxin [Alphaproteobacteria bacterium]